MDNDIDSYLSLPSSLEFVVDINGTLILPSDMELFKPYEWFSDNIINGCLHLITRDSPQTFAFHTWFIEMLVNQGYSENVKRQVNGVDQGRTGELFNKKLVFIPVNPGGNHWALVAINMS